MVDQRMNEEFEQLWLDVVDGTATAEQIDRLNQRLRDDPELRSQLADRLIDDAVLAEELRTKALTSFLSPSSIFPATNPSSSLSSLRLGLPIVFGVLCLISGWMIWQFNHHDAVKQQPLNRHAVSPPPLSSTPTELEHAPTTNDNTLANEATTRVDPVSIIATVVRSRQGTWSVDRVPSNEGKLTTGRYTLTAGSVRLLMTNGIELIVDATAGETEFELVSPRLALLHTGTMVANVHPAEIGFVIQTPTSRVVDVGTQFAVVVDDEGSRVEVLDGAVGVASIKGKMTTNQTLFASSQATNYVSASDSQGTRIAGDSEGFREIHRSLRRPSDEQPKLIAYESFEHPNSDRSRWNQNGWSGPWRYGSFNGAPAQRILATGQVPDLPGWLGIDSTKFLVQPISSIHNRKLADPIDLDRDGTVFLSILMHKRLVMEHPPIDRAGTGLSLYSLSTGNKEQGLGFTIDGNDRFTLWTGNNQYNGGRQGVPDRTYFVVLKISSSKNGFDNVFIRAYQQGDAIDATQPSRWDSSGMPVKLDLQLDVVAMWCGSAVVGLYDELRIGPTWQSVIPIR